MEKVKKKLTFLDYYHRAVDEPTPAQRFLQDIAKLTCKSQITVYRWIQGYNEPDSLTKKVLANHFGCNPDDLFPIAESTQQSNND